MAPEELILVMRKQVRIMASCFPISDLFIHSPWGNLAHVSSVDKKQRNSEQNCVFIMSAVENTAQWQTEAAETSVLPTQWGIIHLCWEIERSHWFLLKKQITFGRENEYSLLPGALAYSSPCLIQHTPLRGGLWKKHFFFTEWAIGEHFPGWYLCCSITLLSTHDRFVNMCNESGLFLEWHFDRLMLFACWVSLIVLFYHHWFPPWLTRSAPMGSKVKEESIISYQSDCCSCSQLHALIKQRLSANEKGSKNVCPLHNTVKGLVLVS